jgi:hypothetical protein
MRFSTIGFLHQSTTHMAMIHGLRPFRTWPRICRENWKYSNFSRNTHADTISTGSFTTLKPCPRGQIGLKKTLPLSVAIASQTCDDLRNCYSPELLSLCWLTEENIGGKKPYMLSHFRFQQGLWACWNRFWWLSKRLSRRIRSHMRNGFSLLIRDLNGGNC